MGKKKWVKKNLGHKIFWSKKNLGQKVFWSKKIWVKKNFGSKKFSVSKKFWVKILFGSIDLGSIYFCLKKLGRVNPRGRIYAPPPRK